MSHFLGPFCTFHLLVFDKTESAGLSGVEIEWQMEVSDVAILVKHGLNLFFVDGARQICHIETGSGRLTTVLIIVIVVVVVVVSRMLQVR